jgi:hypothetical protein
MFESLFSSPGPQSLNEVRSPLPISRLLKKPTYAPSSPCLPAVRLNPCPDVPVFHRQPAMQFQVAKIGIFLKYVDFLHHYLLLWVVAPLVLLLSRSLVSSRPVPAAVGGDGGLQHVLQAYILSHSVPQKYSRDAQIATVLTDRIRNYNYSNPTASRSGCACVPLRRFPVWTPGFATPCLMPNYALL